LIEGIVKDKKHSARVRSLALTRLDRPERHLATIDNLLDEAPALQIEAVRTLARIPDEQASTLLTKIADDTSRPAQVRAEAIAALSWQGAPEQTNEWLKDENPVVRREAARLLRVEPDDERPETLQGWQAALRSGGDPLAGSRVFFSARTMCSQCHTIENRGGNLGPDLSGIASSVDRASIARSILRPSEEFPPQYQVWFIETKDGELHEGLQLDHKAGGALELTTASGGVQFFPAKVIVRYGTKPRSLMPDGLEQTMTVEEFRDLLAFLETRK
jgi:putative heme-binding domain-containing protein